MALHCAQKIQLVPFPSPPCSCGNLIYQAPFRKLQLNLPFQLCRRWFSSGRIKKKITSLSLGELSARLKCSKDVFTEDIWCIQIWRGRDGIARVKNMEGGHYSEQVNRNMRFCLPFGIFDFVVLITLLLTQPFTCFSWNCSHVSREFRQTLSAVGLLTNTGVSDKNGASHVYILQA